ncbi:MAG: response regulator, partial [bacterium]
MDPKPRILVVDDDESVRLSLQLVLQQNGYEVETAATAGEAAQMASARPFHVAVVDIKLPDMDGTQLIALLKERRPETAVIVMTGHASVESAVQALKHDAAAYVIKPANPDELLAEIAESLERRRLVRENRRLLEAAQRELAERERAELALRRSNELLETMFATIHLQIAYLDKDFNFIRVNRAYADAANREPQALVGKNH